MTRPVKRVLFFLCGAAGAAVLVPAGTAQAQQGPIRTLQPGAMRATTLRTPAQAPEIAPPITVAVQPRPDAVILRAGSTNTVIQSLHVTRQHSVSNLRNNPVIALAGVQVDMTPVFANRDSLLNVADRLRTQPALAEVLSDDTQVFEVDQGLVVRQYLSYRPKPGACTASSRRALMVRMGSDCFTRMTDQSRAAAFANPGGPRFIANATQRAAALSRASTQAAKEQAEIAGHIAVLRGMLSNPAQRGPIVAKIGEAEAARLASLNDDQLAEEMANTAEIQIEQVMFLPASDRTVRPVTAIAAGIGRVRPDLAIPVEANKQLKSNVYLTGFTYGRGNEWRKRKSITVNWCVVGCSSTYYVEAYAGFGYGLGLRFPIRMSGQYNYKNGQASVTPEFEPINGNATDYSSTGIPGDQIFDGKEIVAELQAYAGFGYKVPGYSDSVGFNAGKDLTEGLPAPFTNGQFKPPAPGAGNALSREVVFPDPDLLGGLANYGIAGAKLLPAVKVSLTSNKLSFKLKDNISGAETEMTNPGQTYSLAVKPDNKSSNFTIGNPVYSLSFDLTPGIAARLFVDVAVWEKTWDWPVWFPQVSVKLPPAGVTFTCHGSTICSRSYNYSPTMAVEQVASTQPDALPEDPIEKQVELWRRAFLPEWLSECPNEKVKWCETAIKAIAETKGNIMISQMKANPFPPSNLQKVYDQQKGEAEHQALGVIREAKVRNIKEYGEGLIKLYEPAWAKNCVDQLCRDNIHKLALQFIQALVDHQNAKPLASRSEIHNEVNAETNWSAKAKRECDLSIARAAANIQRIRNQPAEPAPVRTLPPGTRLRVPPSGQ